MTVRPLLSAFIAANVEAAARRLRFLVSLHMGQSKLRAPRQNSVHLSTISVRKNSRKVHRISKSAPKI
ncbi:hypothetical protein COLINT_02933 [Collinsella intestinalis DSM 13280]|uniref:Uncharacterized protein n=1 Tax=Collinsella intestinalis DSM 13280 TaxID=521003 RepID=C4FA41_9ACTN|nr:hypothetical protein COLINT_02933 [Collinsella intestinalis DSM 13280]